MKVSKKVVVIIAVFTLLAGSAYAISTQKNNILILPPIFFNPN